MDTSRMLVTLADCLSDGIIVADESGVAYVNSSGLMLLGADHSEDVVGKPLARLFRSDELPKILWSTPRGQGDDSEVPICGTLLRSDGRTVDVCGAAFPILWKGTRPCRLLVVRRAFPMETREVAMGQDQVYRATGPASCRVGRWERDLSTGVETWSDDQYRILGYEPGAVMPTPHTFTKALHQDDRDRVVGVFEQSLTSDMPYDVECRIIQPGGALRFIRCRGVVIRNGAGVPVCVLGTIQDQTADTQSEVSVTRVMRESSERLDLVARAGHVGICEWDNRTGRVYWSPTLREIFGIGATQPASLRRYVKLIHRTDRKRMFSAIRTVQDSTGDGCIQAEHRIVRPDGIVRYISLRVLTRCEGEGSTLGPGHSIGTVVDITDHRLAEAYRHDASKLMTVSTLTGGIAHDFNNSLTAVLGFSQLALQLIPVDSKARRHIQQVIAAGRTSSELINQLWMFSRRSDQARRSLSMPVLVRESVKLLRSTIPSWVELREQIAASVCPIEADEMDMRRMLVIVLTGAVHAMHSASGVLNIELRDKPLSTELVLPHCRVPPGRYICLCIKDSGEGLEAQAGATFDDMLSTARSHGDERGIGLSVVRDIVAAHGGAMLVESRVGQGTMVTVYLPVQTVDAASVTGEEDSLPRGHEGILLVTAEESYAKRGREILESLGYYTVVRTSAASACAAFNLAPRHFDLVIADQMLSDMAGDQLARECRRLRPDLPVILCTGSQDTLLQGQDYSRGFAELVARPLVAHEVAHVIRRVLDRSDSGSSTRSSPPAASRSRYESPISCEVPDAVGPRR